MRDSGGQLGGRGFAYCSLNLFQHQPCYVFISFAKFRVVSQSFFAGSNLIPSKESVVIILLNDVAKLLCVFEVDIVEVRRFLLLVWLKISLPESFRDKAYRAAEFSKLCLVLLKLSGNRRRIPDFYTSSNLPFDRPRLF